MAYSCSDFVDDVLNNLLILGHLKKDDIPDDDPEAQATLAIQSVIQASTPIVIRRAMELRKATVFQVAAAIRA